MNKFLMPIVLLASLCFADAFKCPDGSSYVPKKGVHTCVNSEGETIIEMINFEENEDYNAIFQDHNLKVTPLKAPLASVDGKSVPKSLQKECFGPNLGKEYYVDCVRANRFWKATE